MKIKFCFFAFPHKITIFVLRLNKDTRYMMKDTATERAFLGNSMENHLGIVFLPTDEDGTTHAEMPVDHRTCQPYGTLHGGASLALAESLAGYGSWSYCEDNEIPFGMQVSGNHIAPVRVGNKVLASGKLVHKGSTTHIWDITITTTGGKLVASIRVVNYIIKKK